MNIKKNSLMVKTFTYLITFSITILICLWLFQVEFLKLFYEQYQIKDIKNVASDIIKSNSISKLEKLAYEKSQEKCRLCYRYVRLGRICRQGCGA